MYYLSLSFIACISTELDRHIYRNQAPYRITFSLTQRRIYKILSNTGKKARLPATADILGAQANKHLFKFCEQI